MAILNRRLILDSLDDDAGFIPASVSECIVRQMTPQERDKYGPPARKTCPGCGRELLVSAFAYSQTMGSLAKYCRECFEQKRRGEKIKMTEKPITKICAMCQRELPLTDFFKQKTGKYGVEGKCKDCKSETRRKRKAGCEQAGGKYDVSLDKNNSVITPAEAGDEPLAPNQIFSRDLAGKSPGFLALVDLLALSASLEQELRRIAETSRVEYERVCEIFFAHYENLLEIMGDLER